MPGVWAIYALLSNTQTLQEHWWTDTLNCDWSPGDSELVGHRLAAIGTLVLPLCPLGWEAPTAMLALEGVREHQVQVYKDQCGSLLNRILGFSLLRSLAEDQGLWAVSVQFTSNCGGMARRIRAWGSGEGG